MRRQLVFFVIAAIASASVTNGSYADAPDASDPQSIAILGLDAHGFDESARADLAASLASHLMLGKPVGIVGRWLLEAELGTPAPKFSEIFQNPGHLRQMAKRLEVDWLVGADITRVRGHSRVEMWVVHKSEAESVFKFRRSGENPVEDQIEAAAAEARQHMTQFKPKGGVPRWVKIAVPAVLVTAGAVLWPRDGDGEGPLPGPPNHP